MQRGFVMVFAHQAQEAADDAEKRKAAAAYSHDANRGVDVGV
jgi:hypothetical protein